MHTSRVGEFSLGWGESLIWDDRRNRLYFVDCASQTLYWLDEGHDDPDSLSLPSMPTGIVPTEGSALVGALEGGLHLIDPDTGATTLLSPYPDGLGNRANDACADLSGNLITGTLNLGPGTGSSWWYSARHGWKLLDPTISNTNGPNVAVLDGVMTLVIGDSSGDYYSYRYDADSGTVGERSVIGDVSALVGVPDGATFDSAGGLWCALIGGSRIVCFTTSGIDRSIELPVAHPADVAFGGPDLDRLYVVSVGMAADGSDLDGSLLVVDGEEMQGRPEPRFALS